MNVIHLLAAVVPCIDNRAVAAFIDARFMRKFLDD